MNSFIFNYKELQMCQVKKNVNHRQLPNRLTARCVLLNLHPEKKYDLQYFLKLTLKEKSVGKQKGETIHM